MISDILPSVYVGQLYTFFVFLYLLHRQNLVHAEGRVKEAVQGFPFSPK